MLESHITQLNSYRFTVGFTMIEHGMLLVADVVSESRTLTKERATSYDTVRCN